MSSKESKTARRSTEAGRGKGKEATGPRFLKVVVETFVDGDVLTHQYVDGKTQCGVRANDATERCSVTTAWRMVDLSETSEPVTCPACRGEAPDEIEEAS